MIRWLVDTYRRVRCKLWDRGLRKRIEDERKAGRL